MSKKITCSLKIYNNEENPFSEFSFTVNDPAIRIEVDKQADDIAAYKCGEISNGWMYDYKIIGVENVS